jgi:hypothetical protein
MIADVILLPEEIQLWIICVCLFSSRRLKKTFSESFIEPPRSGRIVAVQQVSKLMRDSVPTVISEQVGR